MSMPAYAYVCMDSQGRTQRGIQEAYSEADLKRWMEQNELFLISWQDQQPIGSMPRISMASVHIAALPKVFRLCDITDADKLSPIARKWQRIVSYWGQAERMPFLLLIVALCICGDIYYMNHFSRTNPFWNSSKMTSIKTKFASISVGMTREQVEKMLEAQPMGFKAPWQMYPLTPELTIYVSFDSTGGPGNPRNLVIQVPHIERNSAFPSAQ